MSEGSAAAPRSATIDLRCAQSPSYRGRGVARYAMELTTALVRHHPDLVDRILLDPDRPAPEGIEALTPTGLLTTATDWAEPGGLFHLMAPFDPDTPLSALWPGVVNARRMRLVVTLYDLIPDAMPHTYLRDPGRRRRYRARCQLLRAADHIVAISACTARDAARYLGVAPDRVTVIGAACGSPFVHPVSPDEARLRARAQVRGLGPAWVLYNGALEPRKNTEELLEAYASLPARIRQRCQLVLACALAPLERNHLEVRSRQLGVEGQVVLPGYVTDDTLVALNQGADLVVFPSRYEGFGLPVAEALACGAAVIASENSAPAELVAPGATFDPDDPAAMTRALARGLTDEPFREMLAQWAARPQPQWQQVAQRAAQVYRSLLTDYRPRPPRPTVAIVTPWPPQRTGVADYSRQLVSSLVTQANVDIFVDGDEPGKEGLDSRQLGLSPRSLPRAARYRGGYDGVVVCLGNSQFHAGGLTLVRTGAVDAVVLAHDVRLTGLYQHSAVRGAVPEGYAQAFASMYPGLTGVVQDGRIDPEVASQQGILMAREMISRGRPLATTSSYASALARLDAAPGEADHVAVLPFAYPRVVLRSALDEEPGLICSFGLVSATKQPLLLIEAVALLYSDPGLNSTALAPRLVFVGPTSDADRQSIEVHAAALAVPVQVLGYSPMDVYRSWLHRASVAVQLRQGTNGETSAAVADCLAHGVATIVSDVGAGHDLPSSVLKLAPEATACDLAHILADLLTHPERRRNLGADSQRWVAQRGFGRAADDLLDLVAERRRP